MVPKNIRCDRICSQYIKAFTTHACSKISVKWIRTYLLVCMSTVPEVMIWRRRRAQSVVHWVLLCTVSNIPPTLHIKNTMKKYAWCYRENTTLTTLCNQILIGLKIFLKGALVYGLSCLLSHLAIYLLLFLVPLEQELVIPKKKRKGYSSVDMSSTWITY